MTNHINVPLSEVWIKLYTHAITSNDVVLYQMLQLYERHPKDWSEFLVDVILAISAENKSLQDRLVEAVSNQPPRPIYLSTKTGKFVPDGAWSCDYPEEYVPDGAWPPTKLTHPDE